ncbi:PilZ domain-containing protein [Haliangium sp.]|uniref:PilZ domain-containing protein n=1 Tax=Haliangium sp. TaxID=2663208 RepID=UPI003D133B45
MPSSDLRSHTDAAALTAPSVTLVREHDGEVSRYALYELHALTRAGATLRGALLLELDEVLNMEIQVDDDPPVRVRARVVRLRRDLPGVEVAFSGLDESDCKRIERRIAAAS